MYIREGISGGRFFKLTNSRPNFQVLLLLDFIRDSYSMGEGDALRLITSVNDTPKVKSHINHLLPQEQWNLIISIMTTILMMMMMMMLGKLRIPFWIPKLKTKLL